MILMDSVLYSLPQIVTIIPQKQAEKWKKCGIIQTKGERIPLISYCNCVEFSIIHPFTHHTTPNDVYSCLVAGWVRNEVQITVYVSILLCSSYDLKES